MSGLLNKALRQAAAWAASFGRDPFPGQADVETVMYRQLVEQSLVGVYLIQDGGFPYCNPRMAEIFGYASNLEIIGKRTVADLVVPDDRELVMDNIRKRLEAQVRTLRYSFRGLRKDGAVIDVEVLGSRVEYKGHLAVIGTLLDITEQNRAQRELRLMANALANTVEAVVVMNEERRIVSVNKAFTVILGYSEAEALDRTAEFLRSGRHHESFFAQIWSTVPQQEGWQGEAWFRRKNGELFPALVSISTARDEASQNLNYVVVVNDISRYRQYEEKLDFLVYHDALTRLPNRALLQQRLADALLRAKRNRAQVALLLLDLDAFKHINESLSHSAGDQLLQAVSDRLLRSVPEHATVARLGGDEFAILLDSLPDLDAAAMAAERLLAGLAAPFAYGDRELFTSASVGISCYPQDGNDAATLVKNADAAMYKAKSHGRNTYQFFSGELNSRALESLTIANNLRYAVERDELYLEYQPIVELANGRITGVEALLRWQSAELGLIPPAKFIPVAEQTGQIAQIGEWVLHTACRQARTWQMQGIAPMRMAVNVSFPQIRQPDFPQKVRSVLHDTRLDPTWLKLELTESMMMEDPEYAGSVFGAVADMGVKIAVDDFGTGYSSLSYLKRLPIDYLKIDRSFVSDLPADSNDAVITRTIIAMAHNLGIGPVAEGIETAAQRDFLQAAGCPEGQGYLFSRPVGLARIEPLLRAGRI